MDLKKLQYIVSKTLRKNLDDLRALATGAYPSFVYRNMDCPAAGQIPVFTFHRMEPVSFEAQLKHLADNHYRSLRADEFHDCLTGVKPLPEKAVLLTFDDCWGSLWAVAHPLLKKYQLNGVAFAISDVMEEGNATGPSLEQVWSGTRSMDEILARENHEPLCNWSEIKAMSRCGTLEFHSHSRLHNSVYVDNTIVDFINPERYPSFMFSDFNPLINVGAREVAEFQIGTQCYGEPIYLSQASYAASTRFIPNHQVGEACRKYVSERGGERFFLSAGWRKELTEVYQETVRQGQVKGVFVSRQQRVEELVQDLTVSKQKIEQRLDNRVDQICLPWYQGDTIAVAAAKQAGYRVCYWGILNNTTVNRVGDDPFYIRRINDEYVFSLPGTGRKSLTRLLANKYVNILRKRTGMY